MIPSDLSNRFGIPGRLQFVSGKGNLPVAMITSPHASAEVSLHGAHVLSFRPSGHEDLLWMSSQSLFETGKPIRGGIPLCFPWFGPHPGDPKKPMHGFARLQMWDVEGVTLEPDDAVRLHLCLKDTPETRALWPHAFRAELIVVVGRSMKVTFRCTNTGTNPLSYGAALHSYFAVNNIANVVIRGLAGGKFYDGPNARELTEQTDAVLRIQKEENRRYLGTTAECIIDDRAASRSIRAGKEGSRVTVVWNPWEATAKNLPDMPDDGYKTMVCIEAVNAFDDVVHLEPNASAALSAIISVER